jgi:hypothetical protein
MSAGDLISAAGVLGQAVAQLNAASFRGSNVRQYGMRSATALELAAVRDDSGGAKHDRTKLLASIDASAAAAAAAAATAAATAAEGDGSAVAAAAAPAPLPSPKTLKRTFDDHFGTMERVAATYHLPAAEEEGLRNLRARHASVESALRTLKRRLGDQEAEAEAHAAEVHGQPATLVTRDSLAAAVASKKAALAAMKRKSEALQQERDTLRHEVAAARQGDGAAAVAQVAAAEEGALVSPSFGTEEQQALAEAVVAERQHLEDLRAVLCARAMAAGDEDGGGGGGGGGSSSSAAGGGEDGAAGGDDSVAAAEAMMLDEEGEGEDEEAVAAAADELAQLRATMLALQARRDELCAEDAETRAAREAGAADSAAAEEAEAAARAAQADAAALRRYVGGAVRAFAPSNDHAAALSLLAESDGEMALDDLKSSTSIKAIYEMVANALIKIDRTQVPNVVLSLVG